MSLSQALYDNALRWQGKSRLHANALVRDIDKVFRRRWVALVNSLGRGKRPKPELFGPALTKELEKQIREFLREIAVEAWEDQMRTIYRATPKPLLQWLGTRKLEEAVSFSASSPVAAGASKEIKTLFVPPTLAKIDRAINANFAGKGWADRLPKWEAAEQIGKEIRQGLADGLTRPQIAKRIRPLVDGNRAAAARIARTEAHRVSVRMQMQSSEDAFGAILIGWLFKTAKDHRVRPSHAVLDGTIYARDDKDLPVPPLSANCRCVLIGQTKSFEDMGLPKDIADLFKPKEIASINGPIKPVKDYGEWFNAQPVADKRDILGDKLYSKIRKRGPVTWTKAVRAWGLRVPKSATYAQMKRAAAALVAAPAATTVPVAPGAGAPEMDDEKS